MCVCVCVCECVCVSVCVCVLCVILASFPSSTPLLFSHCVEQ